MSRGEADWRSAPSVDATPTAAAPALPYPHALDETVEHARLLSLKLERAVERFRRVRKSADDDGLQALAIFDSEIDALLPELCNAWSNDLEDSRIRDQVTLLRARARATQSPERAPLAALAARFRLGGPALELCVMCLAPEIFPHYGRVYAYLQDDATRTRPSVALALDVLAGDFAERVALRAALSERATLLGERLVTLGAGGELALEPAVLEYLIGGGARGKPDARTLDELLLAPAARAKLGERAAAVARGEASIVGLVGDAGAGKRTVASVLAAASGRRVLERPLASGELDGADGGAALERWLRDARLIDAAPLADLSLVTEVALERSAIELARRFRAWGFPLAFLIGEHRAAARASAAGLHWIELGALGAAARAEGWRRALGERRLTFDESQLAAVASLFPFTMGQIHEAARTAADELGVARHLDGPAWRRACRGCARHQLERLAEPVPTPHDWDDLVLPRDCAAQLREIADAAERREQVLDRWRFADKVCVFPGVCALFAGPSGTGKTMAAGVLARQLGMELYRIDLSRVVSKYIGETEKNLDALFAEARRAYAVLLFDEADALFGKRSEVKDAHDRYANIEVAYLLQRMESYEGLTVLATNLRNNLDDAFLRRLQFCVEFPHPGPAERRAIWRKVWPEAAPLDAALDLEFLAQALELTGGQIRNIALKAAYFAAAASAAIGMPHVIAAVRREHQKIGRVAVDRLFGPYARLFAELERP